MAKEQHNRHAEGNPEENKTDHSAHEFTIIFSVCSIICRLIEKNIV